MEVRQEQEILQHSQITSEEAHINDLAMAVPSLGDRLDWSVAYSMPDIQLCSGHSRLLHQVGGGQTLSTISSKKVQEFV